MTTPQIHPFAHFATTEAGEYWLAEVTVDFSAYDAVSLAASLAAVTRGVGGTFRIRIGGASHAADGTQIVEFPVEASDSWVGGISFAPRVVARGTALFKLTASSLLQDSVAEINAGSLTLWAQPTVPPLVFKMAGVDIWLGDSKNDGTPEYIVGPTRDWTLAGEEEAYRQSLRRRFAASPGEYKLKPGYGAGLRAAVKSRGRSSDIDSIKNRMRVQAMIDPRTKRVVSVDANWFGTNGIKYTIVVEWVGDPSSPLSISDEITGES